MKLFIVKKSNIIRYEEMWDHVAIKSEHCNAYERVIQAMPCWTKEKDKTFMQIISRGVSISDTAKFFGYDEKCIRNRIMHNIYIQLLKGKGKLQELCEKYNIDYEEEKTYIKNKRRCAVQNEVCIKLND